MKKDLQEILAERKEQFEKLLRASPKAIREVANVIRSGDLKRFRKFLRRNGIVIMNEDAEAFRDYLITQRLDLKDMEPDARARLRQATLDAHSDDNTTDDYRDAILSGFDLRCRDCQFFVRAPNDDSPNGEKSCVELGTKGADRACFGFTWSVTESKSA